MPRTNPAYPPEFRGEAIRLVRASDQEQTAYTPHINPAEFATTIDNEYFPMKPGTTFVYEGGAEHSEMTVTHDTRKVMGVVCVVVDHREWEGDMLIERTYDWFAQDNKGTVWYSGRIPRSTIAVRWRALRRLMSNSGRPRRGREFMLARTFSQRWCPMMDLDSLLVSLYVLVVDWWKADHPWSAPRKPGRRALLSESEVLTLAILAQ